AGGIGGNGGAGGQGGALNGPGGNGAGGGIGGGMFAVAGVAEGGVYVSGRDTCFAHRQISPSQSFVMRHPPHRGREGGGRGVGRRGGLGGSPNGTPGRAGLTGAPGSSNGFFDSLGGGISSFPVQGQGTTTVKNTIIAANENLSDVPTADVYGVFTSQGHNLI